MEKKWANVGYNALRPYKFWAPGFYRPMSVIVSINLVTAVDCKG